MGAKQSLEETDAPASPRSPTSPRVVPVDSGNETSLSALQGKDSTRGEEALSPKGSGTVTSRDDGDDDAATPLDDEPVSAASQRSLSDSDSDSLHDQRRRGDRG